MHKASNNATSTECELVLRTHFPNPPYVDLDRRSWKQPNRSTVYAVPDLELAQNYNARLTHGVLLSALAAVLLLRNYHRIRRLANAVLRESALDEICTMNRGQGSYYAEDVPRTLSVSQMSTGSEMAPAEILRRRGVKKHVIIRQDGETVTAGYVQDVASTWSTMALPDIYSRRAHKERLVIYQKGRAAEDENAEEVYSTRAARGTVNSTRAVRGTAGSLRSRGYGKHPVVHQGQRAAEF